MPVYEYKCKCGNTLEKFYNKYSDRKDTIICKKCNGKLKLVISNTSFILKGDGWADTGYQKNNKR